MLNSLKYRSWRQLKNKFWCLRWRFRPDVTSLDRVLRLKCRTLSTVSANIWALFVKLTQVAGAAGRSCFLTEREAGGRRLKIQEKYFKCHFCKHWSTHELTEFVELTEAQELVSGSREALAHMSSMMESVSGLPLISCCFTKHVENKSKEMMIWFL